MERIATLTSQLPQKTVVILGNFDGVHLGHILLFEKAKEIAKEEGLKSTVFTFEPHPVSVLSPDSSIQLIYTREEKALRIEKEGIELLMEFPFTIETAQIDPKVFIEEILVNQLNASSLVVGSDFRFGKDRRGDYKLLVELSEDFGYDVHVIHKLKSNHRDVSSSWIRDLIREGNLTGAKSLLGAPFMISGVVQHGKQIGRSIGFPTANLIPPANKLLPPHGVYFVEVLCQGEAYQGITNIGKKPTINGEELTVETHILDFDLDIYGQEISIWLVDFIRDEIKFKNLEELKRQIQRDLGSGRKKEL